MKKDNVIYLTSKYYKPLYDSTIRCVLYLNIDKFLFKEIEDKIIKERLSLNERELFKAFNESMELFYENIKPFKEDFLQILVETVFKKYKDIRDKSEDLKDD